MLFNLTDSILDKNINIQKRNRAVRLIANSVFEKKHMLEGPMDVLDYFCNVFSNDVDIQSVFIYLVDNYAFLYPTAIKRRIDVVSKVTQRYRKEEEVDVYEVSIDELQDSSYLQGTLIIGENDTDCKFYKKVLSWFISIHLGLNINFDLNPELGGGRTTENVISSKIGKHSIFVSIVETDIKYPGCPQGDTSRACKKYENKNKWNYKHFVIPVQEIENLIPPNYIRRGYFNKSIQFHVDKYEFIYKNKPNLLKFFDLKKGIRESDLKNADYMKFAQECCSCDKSITNFQQHCSDVHKQNLLNPNPIVYIYPPLRSDILELVLNDTGHNDFTRPQLLDFQSLIWEEVGQILLDFSCTISQESFNL